MENALIRSSRLFGAAALVVAAVWLYLVVQAPEEQIQGVVQKIFYAHVPSWLPAYLGFFLTATGGAGFLITRNETWDRLAEAAAEVGIVFCTLGLITGPIWAKPVWGTWWVWDLRLTSTLILWFVYVAYLLLRGFAYGSDTARNFASVYGILGTLLIPLVFFAVELAQGNALHPSDPARESGGLPPGMARALHAGFIAYLLGFVALLGMRIEIGQLESAREETQWAS